MNRGVRHTRSSWRELENSRRASCQNATAGTGLTAPSPRSPAGLSRLVPRTLGAGLPVLEAHRGADRLTDRPSANVNSGAGGTPSTIRPCPAGQHRRTHRPRDAGGSPGPGQPSAALPGADPTRAADGREGFPPLVLSPARPPDRFGGGSMGSRTGACRHAAAWRPASRATMPTPNAVAHFQRRCMPA